MKLSPRSQKLGGLVSEVLPDLVHEIFTPDQIGFLTISAVEISGDLGVGDVFVSNLGTGASLELKNSGTRTVVKKLNKKAKVMEQELGKRLKLSKPLKLRFKEDKSIGHVEKMNRLMD